MLKIMLKIFFTLSVVLMTVLACSHDAWNLIWRNKNWLSMSDFDEKGYIDVPGAKLKLNKDNNEVAYYSTNSLYGAYLAGRVANIRNDFPAAVEYYKKEGIPSEAVKEYLLNIANSTFENWRKANPDKSIDEFDFQLNKMSVSGALFDMIKLLDIGKTVISKMTAEEVYNYSLIWAKEYDEELAKMLEDKEYAGLYYTGEILDVDGICGGFNLGFAWLSSIVVSEDIC